MMSRSKSEEVVAEIERRILSGQLAPGQRLPTEGELGEELGYSRSVIRDAMRSLATRRLIHVRHGFGTDVAAPSDLPIAHALADLLMRADVTLDDVLAARHALDRHLAPLMASNATGTDCAELERELDRFARAVAEQDAGVAQEAHLDFHLGLIRAMHLPALELLLKPMGEVILLSSVRPASDPARFELESHPPILAALRAGDTTRLISAIDAHFAVLEGPAYRRFRRARFREVLAHEDFALLRGRLTTRAIAAQEAA
jgi:GntR family transcriptional repressor for pyruvate dehydrogenase complex